MSLAFAAVVLFVLVAPGVIARRTYLSHPFAKRFAATTPTDEVVWAIIPAIVLHLFAIWCVQALGYRINFAVLGHLLVGAKEDSALEAAFLDLQEHIGDIAA